MRLISLVVAGMLLFAPLVGSAQKQPGPSKVEISFEVNRWPYPLYQEVAAKMQTLAKRFPKLARVFSIGKTAEGRDLWVLEIANQDTGPGESKPAMWMDGNIHQYEETGRVLLMYAAEKWLANYGQDLDLTRLLDTRTFYILPMFDADGGERVLTSQPAWPGHKPEQHEGRDLDGDGYITQMRVKDPDGEWYPSPIDSRVMLRLRVRPEELPYTMGWDYIATTLEAPKTFVDDLAPAGRRYRLYTEGQSLDPMPVTVELEPTNFNRNWSAEWKPEEPGAGPYPFSLPEVRAVADFMTSHQNIFFQYTIHGGGGARNYQVRPLMSHPFEDMPTEDNDFYVRVGAIWSLVSHGGVMNNNYYGTEVKAGRYGDTMTGFANDWAYLHLGIHTLLPEVQDSGRDYDNDGYVTVYELLRWNDEDMDGKYFAPWKPAKHPLLGNVETGGWRGLPEGFGDRLQIECETHFRLLTYIAGLSPLVRIKDITSSKNPDGTYRVVAQVQNQGFLSTYVTRQALKIRRDYPIVATLKANNGEVVGRGQETKKVGHILGKLAYIRRWGEGGADESTRSVEWTVKPTGPGPMTVTVEAWSHKGGRDRRSASLGAVAPR